MIEGESPPAPGGGRSKLAILFGVASLVFLVLWVSAELRLRTERETRSSIEAEKGTLEERVRRSAIRDRLHERRSGAQLPELGRVAMTPGDRSSGARGKVFVDRSAGRVFGFFRGLESAREGMTYQLWFSPRGGPPESLGRLVFDSDGDAVVTSSAIPAESPTGELRVTLEQAGGALVPTGREVLRGSLRTAPASATDPEAKSATPTE